MSSKIEGSWEIEPGSVKLDGIIGAGVFGWVRRGECENYGAVAVKILSDDQNDASKQAFFDTITIWKELNHPSIIKLLGICSNSQGPKYIISEFMEKGYLRANLMNTSISIMEMISIALQICQGMKYLASRNLVHRHLNTEDVLISNNWIVKIYRVWWCKKLTDGVYLQSSLSMTRGRGPPEVKLKGIFSVKSDVYLFGHVLDEIATHGFNSHENRSRLKEEEGNYFLHEFKKLVSACLSKDPERRPLFEEIEEGLTKLKLKEMYTRVDEAIYNEAYYRALEEGETVNSRIPIMIVGQDRSGKTSLRKHLQGLAFDAEEPSTCGIEVDVVEVTEVDAEEPWKRKEMAQFIMNEDKATEELLKQAAHLVRSTSENVENVAETDLQASQQLLPLEEKSALLSITDEMPVESLIAALSKDTIDSIISLEESISAEKTPPITAFVHDLAGQCVFYDTHYYFLKPQCPYILVHDLRMPFENPAQPRFRSKVLNVERNLNNPLLATNLDFFLSWLNVLNKLGDTADHISDTYSRDLKLPPVLIALTNSDRFDGDVEEVKQRIKDIVSEQVLDNVYVEPYVIDNTSSSQYDTEVRKLRQKLYDLCKSVLEMQSPVPITWFQLEAQLSKKMLVEKRNYISLDEVRKLGELCKVKDVDAALRFLHRHGVLVHHDGSSVVVLNPVWLMNLFTEVITIPQEDKPSNALYRKLLAEGILMQEYLRQKDDGEILEDLMIQFGLICPWQFDGRSAFIVPSVAPVMEKGDDVQEQLSDSPIAPLFFHFIRGYILPGVFTRFLVKIIDNCRDFLRTKRPRLYSNYTLLSFRYQFECKFDVYVIQELSRIKIGVVPRSTISNSDCVKFALFLKKMMLGCLQSIKADDIPFHQNVDSCVSVKCEVCFGETTPCSRHGEDKCTNDYCAHYWSLQELQRCIDDPVCDFASVVKCMVFPLERVKPWLGIDDGDPPTHEPTINDLNLLKRQNICRKLDILQVTGGDFRELAGYFEMPVDELHLISQQPEATNHVLKWAAKNPSNTLIKLREILAKMKRGDCLEIFDGCT